MCKVDRERTESREQRAKSREQQYWRCYEIIHKALGCEELTDLDLADLDLTDLDLVGLFVLRLFDYHLGDFAASQRGGCNYLNTSTAMQM